MWDESSLVNLGDVLARLYSDRAKPAASSPLPA